MSARHSSYSDRIEPKPRPHSPDGLPASTSLAFCRKVLVPRDMLETDRKMTIIAIHITCTVRFFALPVAESCKPQIFAFLIKKNKCHARVQPTAVTATSEEPLTQGMKQDITVRSTDEGRYACHTYHTLVLGRVGQIYTRYFEYLGCNIIHPRAFTYVPGTAVDKALVVRTSLRYTSLFSYSLRIGNISESALMFTDCCI